MGLKLLQEIERFNALNEGIKGEMHKKENIESHLEQADKELKNTLE